MKRTDDAWALMCWAVSDDSTDTDSGEGEGDESSQVCVMRYVDIRCYWVAGGRSDPSATRATAGPADTYRHGRWVAERSVRSVPISARMRRKLAGAGAGVLATTISKDAFPVITDKWVVQDPGGAGAFSNLADSAQDAMHQFVVGAPAKKVCSVLGVPRAALPVIDEVARELPLGIDGLFDTIKTVAQVAGMAIGVATGVPLVHIAACKAFVHQQVTRGLTREFERALTPPSGREPAKPAKVAAPAKPGKDRGRYPAGPPPAGERYRPRPRPPGSASPPRPQRQSRGGSPHSRG
jgi:hypothetical protein